LPAELPDDVDRVALQVQVHTGLELEDQSTVRVLDNRAWLDRRRWLRQIEGQ
jgi:hypothetical protein